MPDFNAVAPLNLPNLVLNAEQNQARQMVNPVAVAGGMRGELARREIALTNGIRMLNQNPTLTDLMQLQVEMKRFTQTFEMTSSTAKTLHDAHGTIIRNI